MNTNFDRYPVITSNDFTVAAILTLPWIAFFVTIAVIWVRV